MTKRKFGTLKISQHIFPLPFVEIQNYFYTYKIKIIEGSKEREAVCNGSKDR